MVHAIKLTWKLGFGHLSERQEARLHSFIESGYVIGSVLFAVGTIYFFPVEGLEDFTLGCRYYEVGSVLFMGLTAYSELDRFYRRKREGTAAVKIRELVEELLYCLGSFVFLVGTFLFDPTCVAFWVWLVGCSKDTVENTAAALFMVGSFMFSLGSYVNALSIFEAPKSFRLHYMSVTTCYQFGGLLFVAGTMGYVKAFEPNRTMVWVSTWLYMVGCIFYVLGSGLAFISTVASHQVYWEKVHANDSKKKKSKVSKALATVARLALRRRGKGRSKRNGMQTLEEEGLSPDGLRLDFDIASEAGTERSEELDLDDEDGRLEQKLAAVLGEEAGRELVAALREEEEEVNEEEAETPAHNRSEVDVFGAFWRGVLRNGAELTSTLAQQGNTGTSTTYPSDVTGIPPTGAVIGASEYDDEGGAGGQVRPRLHGLHPQEQGARQLEEGGQRVVVPPRERDNVSLMDERG
mmetsp:Transcript_16437/g.35922  ORF Transcript_16437/g.35922 Transcript_16437/m.35922 type:complete len:464 (+) Transcript_16437:342-1733(+)|eukprot:CAMPEP_0206492360 /NCGR_PEP_ID=MMETSP0324_2-20121206/46007_1 /ASSEMBLY_ACC=CAM_ASM_000836 /TAXON_ID=2866 /ORGANISM="Crypthecodinium cohnii, Strain Seligo" /LENGTH=463 /DNA_ID=CAMNT_0053974651 /DNA_START=278 /DNA_END=1669 /DNA_ORIENTATION=-